MYLDKAVLSSTTAFPTIICILVIHFYEFNIPILVRFLDQRGSMLLALHSTIYLFILTSDLFFRFNCFSYGRIGR